MMPLRTLRPAAVDIHSRIAANTMEQQFAHVFVFFVAVSTSYGCVCAFSFFLFLTGLFSLCVWNSELPINGYAFG